MPVPDFSPGEVLTAAAMDSIGLWLVKTQTVGTTVSSVTVTGAFSADYQSYKITYNGGILSAGALINMQLGSTNTGYYASRALAKYSDGSILGQGVSNFSSFFGLGVGGPNGALVNIDLFDPFSSKRTLYSGAYSAALTNDYAGNTGGFQDSNTSFTAFTLSLSGGTMTGGTIRVYGYRN
jgi:hypothetical protein